MRKQTPVTAVVVLQALAFTLTGCNRTPPPMGTNSSMDQPMPPGAVNAPRPTFGTSRGTPPTDVQMALGNPDGATAQASQREKYLIRRPQYDLSYNDTLHFPNWVSWRLIAANIGSTERGSFKPENTFPAGFTAITPSDYTNTGFDRGHNCPSKDRSDTRANNDAVFLMSNMTPQTHAMNAGPWERLESDSRQLAQQGNTLYIYCGHGFNSARRTTIGRAGIAVPDFGWKIVTVVPGNGSLDKIGGGTRVIAIKVPNTQDVASDGWTRYVTTPADIEKATGLHFFTGLPPAVAESLRNKRDSGSAGSAPTAPTTPTTSTRPSGGNAGAGVLVWVNTKSGAYWKPGTQYYGKTKQGTFMSESDALKAGYHAAGGQ